MFFKNKHVIASLIIAPILALISYFAVDYYVSEVPHLAKQGQDYKMLVKPNCRWESGYCDLVNNDLKIKITSNNQVYGNNKILLSSTVALQGVEFKLVESGVSSTLMKMNALNSDNKTWESHVLNIESLDYLQFVVSANQSIFYAQVPAVFVYKEKAF